MSTKTRETILRTLRARGKCTVKELAEAAGVSPVSVRHHLTHVQAEGLVAAEEVRHGVGRPRLLYSLTETGQELFPSRYLHFANRLVEQMKGSLPEDKVAAMFSGVASAMAAGVAQELDGLPWQDRLRRLGEILSSEGFEAQVEQRDDQVVIRERSCPYFQIGQRHREVCTIDQGIIARALSVPVERVSCLLDGDMNCTFTVNLRPNSLEVVTS
ncbi:MAG: helix-turn-helix transcriptional regulator [Anaerolineales bacterium]